LHTTFIRTHLFAYFIFIIWFISYISIILLYLKYKFNNKIKFVNTLSIWLMKISPTSKIGLWFHIYEAYQVPNIDSFSTWRINKANLLPPPRKPLPLATWKGREISFEKGGQIGLLMLLKLIRLHFFKNVWNNWAIVLI
jgi:hypothetical protein